MALYGHNTTMSLWDMTPNSLYFSVGLGNHPSQPLGLRKYGTLNLRLLLLSMARFGTSSNLSGITKVIYESLPRPEVTYLKVTRADC